MAAPPGSPGQHVADSSHRRQRREAVAACRREVLTTLLGWGGPVFLMHPEPPKEYKIPGNWQPADEATGLVPPDFNPDDAGGKHWLSLGDWRFYSAPGPAKGSPDHREVRLTRVWQGICD
jgi:hypothetical protein